MHVDERPAVGRLAPPPDPRAKELVGITILRADGTRLRRVGGHVVNVSAVWSPDGRRLAYTALRQTGVGLKTDLHVVEARGRTDRTIASFRGDGNIQTNPAWLVRRQ